jgi:hypothetical protein
VKEIVVARTRASMRAAAAAVLTALWWISVAPAARGDTLDNELTITCTPDSEYHTTCIIGGCERVNGDHVIDAIHVGVASPAAPQVPVLPRASIAGG